MTSGGFMEMTSCGATAWPWQSATTLAGGPIYALLTLQLGLPADRAGRTVEALS